MKIYLEKEDKTINFKLLKKKMILKEILDELNISTNSIILVKNDKITLDDSVVEESDDLKILSVVSGG